MAGTHHPSTVYNKSRLRRTPNQWRAQLMPMRREDKLYLIDNNFIDYKYVIILEVFMGGEREG